jgi:DNA repair exonuclease SbcCD ATPase subunit
LVIASSAFLFQLAVLKEKYLNEEEEKRKIRKEADSLNDKLAKSETDRSSLATEVCSLIWHCWFPSFRLILSFAFPLYCQSAQLKQDLAEKKKREDALLEQLSALEKAQKDQTADLGTTKDTIAQVLQQKKQAEEALAQSEKHAAQLAKSLATETEDHEKAKKQLKDLMKEEEDKREQLKQAKQERDDLQKKVTDFEVYSFSRAFVAIAGSHSSLAFR